MNKSHHILNKQLLIIVSGFVLIILLAGMAQQIGSRSVDENFERLDYLVSENNAKFALMTTMRDVIRKRMLLLYDIILNYGDEFDLDEKAIEYSLASGEFIAAREKLLKLTLTEQQKQQIDNQRQLLGRAQKIVDAVLIHARDDSASLVLDEIIEARNVNEQVLLELQNMRLLQQRLAQRALIDATNSYEETKDLIQSLTFSALVISVFIIAFVVQRISSQGKALNNALDELEEANHTLEDRVIEKTEELLSSQSENIRMSAELDTNRKLQQILLPTKQEIKNIKHLDIATYMLPASEVGGDYYDILKKGDNILIGVGDVTGHGLESGVVMLMTQSIVRALFTHDKLDIKNSFNTLNNTLYHNINRMECEKNISVALLEYQYFPENDVHGEIKITGQHESIILIRQDKTVELIDTDGLGFPIGLVDNIDNFINSVNLKLYKGDLLILFTDGVTEASDINDKLYGVENLYSVALEKHNQPAEIIKNSILENLKQHIGNQEVFDDITLLVIKQN